MKQLTTTVRYVWLILFFVFTVLATPLPAQAANVPSDSLEVSLLTCSPYEQEVYSLYGHTAIRCHDWRSGDDWVFNYGVFNFKKPFFVVRFIFGLTDYELGVVPFDIFIKEYERQGRQVTEQVLNLSTLEKWKLYQALASNYEDPSRREYRYNYFTANCTTKARDIITSCVDGTIVYPSNLGKEQSYRQMLHEMTRNHRWAALGNDLCLGARADMAVKGENHHFLPHNLMEDFCKAAIVKGNASRPLVDVNRVLLHRHSQQQGSASLFPTPTACALALLAISVGIALLEKRKDRCFVAVDILYFSVTATLGLVLTLLLFSQHPTTSTNLQWLLFNPLPLFFLPALAKQRTTRFWSVQLGLLLLFFAGAMIQDYAEGTEIVALCLLTRCWTHRDNILHRSKNQ